MNEIQEFNFNGFDVRTVQINGEPYFVGKDVADVLHYANTAKAIRDHVDNEDKLSERIVLSGQNREAIIINESGLYSLILSSKLSNAKEFKHWVTHEVLPTIRKHGAYLTNSAIENTLTDPDYLVRLANQLKAEHDARVDEQRRVAEMTPKALFSDAVTASKDTILVRDMAKLLKQNGIEISQGKLFNWLVSNGYLLKQHNGYVPSQRAMNQGLFEVNEWTVTSNSRQPHIRFTTKVTGKGQQYFVKKFLRLEAMEGVK